ncbi:MAG: 6-phosphofructokinase [Clostridia bacterium]|nr:6-phosphofructokinase [Clostridia bacterium]
MAKFQRIGVLTSGGDAPGMNAAVRAVTRSALLCGVEVMGIYGGYQGLMDDEMKLFHSSDVSGIISRGGTILYSARALEFKTEEGMAKAIAVCKKNHIDGIVAIGGDGTFRGATDLSIRGIPTVGIPGTIDNDISSTDYTIGFDTAMNTVIDLIDKLRDTCESHARCNVVEVMGRGAGDIAIQSGLATGAIAIAVGEIPFDEEAAIERIRSARANGKRNFIVVVAEGKENYAEGFTKRIQEQTGIESRFTRLGHVQRGGNPTLRDRVTASMMGSFAVDKLFEGQSDIVVCERNSRIVAMNIGFALKVDKLFKGKLTPEEIAAIPPAELSEMQKICDERQAKKMMLYNTARITCK